MPSLVGSEMCIRDRPAGARPHIHGSDTCCIVDIDISTGKRICRIDEHRPIFITQLADTQPLRINVGFGAEHTLYKLLLSLIHISEPTRLGMISYAVFCLKKKKKKQQKKINNTPTRKQH